MAKMRFGTGASRKVVVLEYYRYKPETVYTYMAFKKFMSRLLISECFLGLSIFCFPIIQGSSTQVRFQPSFGRYIAAVVGSSISIVDVETAQTCGNPLKVGGLHHNFHLMLTCLYFSGIITMVSISSCLNN